MKTRRFDLFLAILITLFLLFLSIMAIMTLPLTQIPVVIFAWILTLCSFGLTIHISLQ